MYGRPCKDKLPDTSSGLSGCIILADDSFLLASVLYLLFHASTMLWARGRFQRWRHTSGIFYQSLRVSETKAPTLKDTYCIKSLVTGWTRGMYFILSD